MDELIINGDVKCGKCGDPIYCNEKGLVKVIDARFGLLVLDGIFKCGTFCSSCLDYVELAHKLPQEVQDRAKKRYNNYFYYGECQHFLSIDIYLKIEKNIFRKWKLSIRCIKCKRNYKVDLEKYEKLYEPEEKK